MACTGRLTAVRLSIFPTTLTPHDEEAVKAYILSVWDNIPLPSSDGYVDGSDELDEESLDIYIDEEKLIDKETCRRLSAAAAKSGAQKICGIGECICDYECGHPNRIGHANCSRLLTGTVECPLAKYGVKPEENPKPWWERHASEMEPTDDELFAICSCCDNTDVVETSDEITAIRKDLYACSGCPVKMVEDAIQEARAEGACS